MEQAQKTLTPYMTPLGAWAFALGTAIGWGSLVVTSNDYLLQAGPWGSILGLLVGAAVMIVIARNYHYLMNRFPSSGGAYTYVKEAFGYDHGFLTAWFLSLTYMAIFWANATSLPLFSRYFLGSIFQFGFHYTIFGYEVYLVEILLTLTAIALVALLCMRSRKAAMNLNIGMALILTAAITICFIAAACGFSGAFQTIEPGFLPDKSVIQQVVIIACISPWAFIGFENISHSAEEFTFSHTKVFRIMVAAVATATVLYLFLLLLSVIAYPSQYGSWLEYISDLKNLDGIEGLPTFYAAYHYLGSTGVNLLMAALLGLIGTSLIGNLVALTRLFYALSKDNIMRRRYTVLNKHHIPSNTILLVVVISLVIPFLGRTAVGWIVDVTTIGATIIYGFVSAATMKTAKENGDSVERTTGAIGLAVMIVFGLFLLLPSLLLSGSMATESYFLFTAWGILGFLFFRTILSRDKERRFGRSVVVWIGLLSLVVFFSFAWMGQSLMSNADDTVAQIESYYASESPTAAQLYDESVVEEHMRAHEAASARTLVTAAALFAIALAMLLMNFTYISRWARENEEQLFLARGIALKDPLTGVKSLHAYQQTVAELNERIEAGSAEPFSLAICDLNGLKAVNDTKGHKAGDDYIRAACTMICELFDHSPVYRIGGDEFVVVLTDRDFEDRDMLVAKMHSLSKANIGTDNPVVAIGLSDYLPEEDASARAVFDRADAQMYVVKRELKNMGAEER